jgi:hypothetical protein
VGYPLTVQLHKQSSHSAYHDDEASHPPFGQLEVHESSLVVPDLDALAGCERAAKANVPAKREMAQRFIRRAYMIRLAC